VLRFQKLSALAALPLAVLLSAPLHAQDQQDPQQPSLGDLARQLRKDKEKNSAQPKTVITDDNMPANKGGLADLGASQGPADGSGMAKASAALERVGTMLDKLDPMDRATLAKAVLMDKDVDFVGRRSWEEKLFAAKEQYVSQGRELVREMKQALADAQSLSASRNGQEKVSPNDPRAQELLHRLQEIMQSAVRMDSAYQAVVMEGWDRAKQVQK